MIELVFVIVILGIMASLAMGRMDRDLRQEAAETILSHIRLTQQLALRDNKHRANDTNWYTRYWQMEYLECDTGGYFYRVGSHYNHPNWGIDIKEEAAIDPVNGKYIWTDETTCSVLSDTSENVLLTKKFGISNIVNTGGCSAIDDIGFDYLGRPYNGIAQPTTADFSNIMTTDCNLTFTMSTDQDDDNVDDDFTITIEAETGNAFIVGHKNL